jgi:hypothetical protein
MKAKNLVLPLLALSFCCLVFMQSSAPPPPVPPAMFEAEPPIVDKIWVKKLPTPLPSGANMIIMRIKYKPDPRLPLSMFIHYGDADSVLFTDNGSAPDVTLGDGVFSAYITENIPNFVSQITGLKNNLISKGKFLHFTGHLGEVVDAESVELFDEDAFAEGLEVEISTFLSTAGDCEEELLKQNSLFITDLAVVEDPARTYNEVNGGNPVGIYTFGNLMKNICNQSYSGVAPKEFLKQWLKRWVDPGVTINGQAIPRRPYAFTFLIGPWIQAAGGGGAGYYDDFSNLATWEQDWDACDEDALLEHAPFRLMAIANRIDLRGNTGYLSTLSNAGETRFIFTLVAPFPLAPSGFPVTAVGEPPMGADGSLLPDCAELLDWKGMNVIIEYGNPFNERCLLKQWAQKWADLSSLSLGSTAYKDALEDILEPVIKADGAILRTNNNRSCLNQLRTNERIFHSSACHFGLDFFGVNIANNWRASDWELSQFEINGGYLRPAPVTNTPRNISNSIMDLDNFWYKGGAQAFATTQPITSWTANPQGGPLINWVYWKQLQVSNGNHNLPLNYSYGGYNMDKAGTAQVDMEAYHFWDLNWPHPSTANYTNIPSGSTGREDDRDLRRQLSVNTCQGCHNGETKNIFTVMRPLGVGVPARYWLPTPDEDLGPVDAVRFAENVGSNKINFSILGVAQRNNLLAGGNIHIPRVAGFLTGRAFTGAGSETWDDDLIDPSSNGDDLKDHTMDRLYNVFDPSNRNNSSGDANWLYPEGIHGFNDLEMRKTKLCELLNSGGCEPIGVIVELMNVVNHVPLPMQGS